MVMRTIRMAAAAIVTAAALAAIERWAIDPIRCARASARASRALDASSGESAARRAAVEARSALLDCESAPSHEVYVTLGRAHEILGERQSAMAAYRRALRYERRPETYFAIGMVALDSLDRPTAIENLARACAFDPRRLAHIEYDDVRRETELRVRQTYGDDWLR